MVNVYVGNVRRAVQRMTNLLDNTRNGRPREFPTGSQDSASFSSKSQAVLAEVSSLEAKFQEFNVEWSQLSGRQQSPLIDRIPPRGVELWRDFWDTVRKQVRRINQEFWQLSQDMTRMLTGRVPSTGPAQEYAGGRLPNLFYFDSSEELNKQFQVFYDKMSVVLGEQQQRMDNLQKVVNKQQSSAAEPNSKPDNLYDEQDDEMTRNELNRNPALRQQIQQEINIFGSIFDIMGTFIQRLRESATNAVRNVIPGVNGISNNNDMVTPGPSVKPQVDKILGETINSQRDINSQAKPVLLPNVRPTLNPKA